MKKLVLILVFLMSLVTIFVIRNGAKDSHKETYLSQVIIDAPWGKEPGEFGIYDPPEGGPTIGPQSFTLAPNDDIYIEDGRNRRIQRFSPEGKFLNMISNIQGIEDDFCVDRNGDVYISYKGIVPAQVWKYDQKGNILKKYILFRGGGGNLFCDDQGRLFIASSTVYQFGTISTDFSPEHQKATLKEGFVGSNNVVLNQGRILQIREGNLCLVELNPAEVRADSTKPVKEFNIYRMNLGQVGFTGVDEKMNIYTCKADLKTYSWIMRKYNPEGELVAEFNIEEDNYAHASRALVLDEHGNIYVMSTSEEGLKIIKWSPVEGGQ